MFKKAGIFLAIAITTVLSINFFIFRDFSRILSDLLLTLTIFLVALFFSFGLSKLTPKKQFKETLLALCVCSISFFTILLFYKIPFFSNLKWNWTGKSASLLFLVAYLQWVTPTGLKEIGFQRINPKSILPLILFIMVIWGAIYFFNFSNSAVALETLLFQMFIPTIEEELLYRGILYIYLNRNFDTRVAGVVSSLLFGLAHGLTIANFALSFNIGTFLLTFIIGYILWLYRYYSESLYSSMLIHASINASSLIMSAIVFGIF